MDDLPVRKKRTPLPRGTYAQPRGKARLAAAIKIYGEEGFLEDICLKIAEGKSPREIAVDDYQMPWVVLRNWIDEDPQRSQVLERSKRAFGDKLAWDAYREVKEGKMEEVSLHKLRAETYLKLAGIHDRKQYGAKMEVEVNHNISILDALKEAHARVEKDLKHEPLTLENNQ